jgi:hypothetical protein
MKQIFRSLLNVVVAGIIFGAIFVAGKYVYDGTPITLTSYAFATQVAVLVWGWMSFFHWFYVKFEIALCGEFDTLRSFMVTIVVLEGVALLGVAAYIAFSESTFVSNAIPPH